MSRPEVDGLERGLRGAAARAVPRQPRRRTRGVARALRERDPKSSSRRSPASRGCSSARAKRRQRQRRRRAPPPAPAGPAPAAAPPRAAGARRAVPTRSCSAASRPRWRSSRRIRMHGHLAARLDPLGSEPPGDPALEPRAADPEAHAGAAGAHPRVAPPPLRRGRDARRRAAAAARDLLRDDRLRDRAPLRPRGARLAAAGDRVGPLPPAAHARRAACACSAG